MNHTQGFNGSATVSDLTIRPQRKYVWHRPDGLISPCPHQLGNGIRPIAHVVNFGDRDNRFVGRSDLSHVLVPDIDNTLLGDKCCRVANRLILSVGNSLTDTAAGPSRRQFFCEETRDFRHDGIWRRLPS